MVTTDGRTSLATCVTWQTAPVGWPEPVLSLCPGIVAAALDALDDAGESIALAITPPITPPTTAQPAQAAMIQVVRRRPRFEAPVDVIAHHPPVVTLRRSSRYTVRHLAPWTTPRPRCHRFFSILTARS